MNELKAKPIYLDYQATTPTDPRVVEAMLPYFTEKFGNPHSRNHSFGWEAEDAVEVARAQVAKIIGASAKEIIFTSGATESNNLALKGVMKFYGKKKPHLITVVTEHKCVLDSARHLEQEGYKVTYLGVKENGLIDLEELKAAITDETALVSVMGVNNEIGVIQPLKEIGTICRERKVFFHTDCAQAVGKIDLDVEDMNIDLMSISGHKIYGPKGIGALFVRRRPRVRVIAQITGGGQERGMRSGTLPTPLIVGLGKACDILSNEMAEENARIAELRDYTLQRFRDRLADIYLNGDEKERVCGNLNVSFAYVEGESLLMDIKNIAVSSGSACTSASLEPSYVLRALGVDEELAHTSLRIGIGRYTTKEELDTAVDAICTAVERLREMSPLWEMAQEGIDLKSIEWAEH
ncbi:MULTISPECIES: IscS subfamily cysteine desulfurase [Thalassospira]|uniref:Cysteine desulfurase IscS n=1 Tax=Thalassospira povalilytica TaxID=732237 RepID=A0ABX4R511_9PROT|nr:MULTISPECIES: IscS subfamily cysteine desulfurase [Thalassospira]MEE3043976.1 IscS subfamily cysteine desulfurase [Pseudomonadota bacterium]RCK23686.1 cysteine desulfurase [Thalassospira profundimaris]KZB62607.1 cysteine desulfurase [Thalassospira sp. MCCC 1A02491]MAL39234.1 IscS subfamily cysteine desulfurase [Thalassospira sp.]MBO6772879.1 IscS subfamily cysteine desulfurase [Thalassospira sp.]